MTFWAAALAALAGPALLVASGLGLSALLPGLPRLGRSGGLGLAYLLGVAYCGSASFVASHVLGLTLRRGLFLPLLLAPAVLALALRALRPSRPPGSSSRGGHERGVLRRRGAVSLPPVLALCVGGGVTAALLLDAAAQAPRDFDGRMTWLPQARWMRAERTVSPRPLTDEAYHVIHPQYPPLMALVRVAVAETLDLSSDEERAQRGIDAAFFPAFLLLLYFGARSLAGARSAAVVTVLAACAPQLSFIHEGGARGSYADFPLAALASAGALVLLRGRGLAAGFGGGLLLAGAVLTKNEGAPLAVAALLGAASLELRRAAALWRRPRDGRRAARALVPAGVTALLVASSLVVLASWRAGIPNRNDEAYQLRRQDFASVDRIVEKLAQAGPVIVAVSLDVRTWGALWLLVPAALLVGARWWRSPAALALLPSGLAPPGIAMMAYLWHWDPAGLAGVTWSRLVTPAVFPLLLLVAIALRPALAAGRPAAASAGGRPARGEAPSRTW